MRTNARTTAADVEGMILSVPIYVITYFHKRKGPRLAENLVRLRNFHQRIGLRRIHIHILHRRYNSRRLISKKIYCLVMIFSIRGKKKQDNY